MDDDTKEILNILKELRNKEENSSVLILDKDEIKVLKEIIKDREAFGRVWTWTIYAVGGVTTILIGWSVISGNIFKWIKSGIN